jgi:protein-S-isoprenylcysteine O-methyltransferase Ste14
MRQSLTAETGIDQGEASQRPAASEELANLKALVGSGDKIALFALPFIAIGLALNVAFPSVFSVGGPSPLLRVISLVVLIPGIATWIWSVLLILARVPKGMLITTGPYSIVKHPLYTGVAFLVLPWFGFLLHTWLGLALGIILYVASRLFSPEEEELLSKTFGSAWDQYTREVRIPWL